MTLLQDVFEPIQVKELMEQSIPVSIVPLNSMGYADYQWVDVLHLTNQVERKQIDEVLSDIDGVEGQLRKEITKADRTYLLYEGTFEPVAGLRQACQSWKKMKGRNLMVPSRRYNVSYAGVMAWFDQLDRAGITIVNTCDYVGTAMTLVALYNNSQKVEHTTLKRYIKERIYPKPHNPHIETLMGIKGVNLGEAKAKALVERFGTVWYILNQSVESLAETLVGDKRLGEVVAKKLLEAVGRGT